MKNKVVKKYFLLSIKKEIPFVIFNLVVFSLLYILPLAFTGGVNFKPTINSYRGYYNLSTNYGYLIAALAVYAVIIPVKAFNFLTKKKYINSYYSLPIEREDITKVQILVNIICVLVPFTLVFFTGSLITLIMYPEIFYVYYIALYFMLIICFISYFIFNTFFFTRANKIIDGVVTLIFANFVFLLLVSSIIMIFDLKYSQKINLLNIEVNDLYTLSLPFMSFITYGNYFNEMIITQYDYYDYVNSVKNNNIYNPTIQKILNYEEWFTKYRGVFNPSNFMFLIVIGVLALILFIILFKKRKPEQSEEIGNSIFGLKVLSPVCFSLLTIIISIKSDIAASWLMFGIVIIGYLGTTLLELRTFKFPLYKILMLVGMFTLTFLP